VKLPAGWAVPARMLLVVVLEFGLRTYASRSGLGAVLLSPSGPGTDFALLIALLLMLVRLTALWIVLPLTVAWGMMTLWRKSIRIHQARLAQPQHDSGQPLHSSPRH
jgi:hypothetical protein